MDLEQKTLPEQPKLGEEKEIKGSKSVIKEFKKEIDGSEYIISISDPHFPRIKEWGYLDIFSDFNLIFGGVTISKVLKEKKFMRRTKEIIERLFSAKHIFLTPSGIDELVKDVIAAKEGRDMPSKQIEKLLEGVYNYYKEISEEYKQNIDEALKDSSFNLYPIVFHLGEEEVLSQ